MQPSRPTASTYTASAANAAATLKPATAMPRPLRHAMVCPAPRELDALAR